MKNWTFRIVSTLAIVLAESPLYSAWNQPPDLVSTTLLPPADEGGPVLRVNSLGNAVAVWEIADNPDNNFGIAGASYIRGIGWAPPQVISSMAGDYSDQTDPDVAFNSTGYAVAAWEGFSTGDSANVIITARRSGTGVWSPVEVISDASGDLFNSSVNVNMNEAGTTIAIWTAVDEPGPNRYTAVSFLPFGGSWTAPFYFPAEQTQTTTDRKPYASINPSGNAVAVWIARIANNDYRVYGATYTALTNTWTAPVILDFAESDLFQLTPRSAIDPSGNAVAIWTRSGGGFPVAKVAYFNGTVWQPSITLGLSSEIGDFVDSADVIMDSNGNATAVWNGREPEYFIYASSRLPNGTWTAPQVISAPFAVATNGNTVNPFMSQQPLSVNAQGDVIATWLEFAFGFDNPKVVAAYKPFGQDWRASETVAVPFVEFPNFLNVGIASCGFAVALWWQDGEEQNTVWATEYENLLLVQNPTATHCKQSFASQSRHLNILTWDQDPCALSYNVYCNGVFVANVPNVANAEEIRYVHPLPCKNQCSNYTVTVVNIYGFEGALVPVIFE